VTLRQPTATVTRDDVERIVRRDFAPHDVPAALALIAQYGVESYEREADRVQAAALKQARGDLNRLRQQIGSAKMDYRDLLADAEYPEATRVWSRIDRMTEAERRAIYDADWRQYDEWLTRV